MRVNFERGQLLKLACDTESAMIMYRRNTLCTFIGYGKGSRRVALVLIKGTVKVVWVGELEAA